MSPPRWVDEHGQALPDAALPDVRARDSDQAGTSGQRPGPSVAPRSVATWVEWCGHQQEVILVPDGDGWYSEIPVLGVAR